MLQGHSCSPPQETFGGEASQGACDRGSWRLLDSKPAGQGLVKAAQPDRAPLPATRTSGTKSATKPDRKACMMTTYQATTRLQCVHRCTCLGHHQEEVPVENMSLLRWTTAHHLAT